MKIKRLDHIVLTVSDLAQAERFYHEVFDMPVIKDQTTEDVITLRCGHQLIRLRKADICIVSGDKMSDIENHLKSYFVNIVAGPMTKMGSEGEMTSIYLRDYDQNLIEISTYK